MPYHRISLRVFVMLEMITIGYLVTVDFYVLKYTGCFRLTTCNSESESQNIHAYGVMLIVSVPRLHLSIFEQIFYFIFFIVFL